MRRYLFAVAAILAAPVAAQPAPQWDDILPPALPWHGRSERLIAWRGDPWITPSEAEGFRTTPSYAATRAWLERLAAASPLVRVETFGRSVEGRDLLAVIVSKDGAGRLDPAKPLVLVQAGIHPGEIDGKDAGLMLLRDIALRGKDTLLDRANLLFIPILSPDGHENSSSYNRPNQRGPENQGWRSTAQNINLNRDYAKADSPEMQALIALIDRYDPDLYIDVHVTDGIDYVHDITFSYPGWGGRNARGPATGAWLDGPFRRDIAAALRRNGHLSAPYPSPVDPRAPEKGLRMRPAKARTSTGYGDLRRLPTVLVETHSLKPYRQRVLGTYVLLEQTLRTAGEEGAVLKTARRTDLARRPDRIDLAWADDMTGPTGSVLFHPVERETYQSPASGREEVRWLGRPGKPLRVPIYGARAVVTAERPEAYWVAAGKAEVIDRLRRHGIVMETLTAPRAVRVEVTRLVGARQDPNAEKEGRFPVSVDRYEPAVRDVTYPMGSVRVPTDQPLGELASVLLEPASIDSFLSWGFFPEIMQRTEYIDGYVIAPLADRMLAADPALAAEFRARLAADPAFAKDGDRRLEWFYQRTPFYDARFMIYPVGRELRR
jgi:hypothetical protein